MWRRRGRYKGRLVAKKGGEKRIDGSDVHIFIRDPRDLYSQLGWNEQKLKAS